MTAYLEISGVHKRFADVTVLDGVNMSMERGEFVALLGPSGCGKTTLLRILAGLVTPDAGTVHLGGANLDSIPAHKRNIGVVFQSYALFPHKTVAENVGFGLKVRGMPKAEIRSQVDESLKLVHMADFANRSVRQLSGGQQQRVALARALAIRPRLLLLDEPLAALDRKLRESVQVELRQLLRRLEMTAIFVTHDQEEALVLSDRIGVMSAGRIEQLGTPREVYHRPKTRFVLDFVGRSCSLPAVVREERSGTVILDTPCGPLRAPGNFIRGAKVLVAVRPEALRVGSGATDDSNAISLRVSDQIFLGSRTLLTFDLPDGVRFLAEVDGLVEVHTGKTIQLWWPVGATSVFPREDGPAAGDIPNRDDSGRDAAGRSAPSLRGQIQEAI